MGKFVPTVAILVALSINCAMFREGIQIPKSENALQIGKNLKKSLSFSLKSTYVKNGGAPTSSDPLYIAEWEKTVREEASASGLFTDVVSNGTGTDYSAEIEILEKGELNEGLAFLTGFTLFLFPSSAKIEESIKATFKNKSGKVVGVYEKREKSVFWQQLFLIFIAPFNLPGPVSKKMKVDLTHAIFKDAADQTIFK